MLQRTTALLEKTVSYKVGATDTSFAQRPKALHQLGVNYRWSSIVVDEQAPLEADAVASAAYRPEDSTVLRAGDRAPDSPGLKIIHASDPSVPAGAITSLFCLFKPTRHTVLLFASKVEDVQDILHALQRAPKGTVYTVLVVSKDVGVDGQSPPVDLVLVDQEGHAHNYYPPVSDGFNTIIIRPDAVVGAVVRSVDGAQKYLSEVFRRQA